MQFGRLVTKPTMLWWADPRVYLLVLRESRRSLSVEPVQLVTLWAKVTCTVMNGVEIMTRVPRRHGDRHGESKGTSPKISNL